MFTAINLARVSGIDPESALRATNAKFERRFAYVENRDRRARGRKLEETLAGRDGQALGRGQGERRID